MSLERRDFFKQLALVTASFAVLPTLAKAAGASATASSLTTGTLASASGVYKVLYTFTASSMADAQEFRQLIKTCGVKSHNISLENQGHIISRSEFQPVGNGSMQSEIVFKSKESYDLFLESSKSVSAELIEFKKNKNIQIQISPVA